MTSFCSHLPTHIVIFCHYSGVLLPSNTSDIIFEGPHIYWWANFQDQWFTIQITYSKIYSTSSANIRHGVLMESEKCFLMKKKFLYWASKTAFSGAVFLSRGNWVFFLEHSRFTGQQVKKEAISLSPLYHFHPLYRHLDISRAVIAESSPLHIASSRTRTGNLWFSNASC